MSASYCWEMRSDLKDKVWTTSTCANSFRYSTPQIPRRERRPLLLLPIVDGIPLAVNDAKHSLFHSGRELRALARCLQLTSENSVSSRLVVSSQLNWAAYFLTRAREGGFSRSILTAEAIAGTVRS